MKKEITIDLDFKSGEAVRCEMHSFCNLLTILVANIQIIAKILRDPEKLEPSLKLCREMLDAFSDRGHALDCVRNMGEYKKVIQNNVQEALRSAEIEPRYRKILDQTVASLDKSLDISDLRSAEILEREKADHDWIRISVDDLVANMKNSFDAIAKNSGGRYGIAYDPDDHGSGDYLLLMDFASDDNGIIHMPAVLSDTLRDLAANARKYSLPGSRIVTEIKESVGELVLSVRDEGRGIPEDEIEKVILFGVRGSNTTPEETKGGGFGLTKAYAVTRRFGGRMWIESQLGIGTEVIIRIPLNQQN